ncbi:hypothetical protein TNCV_4036991 [Trichonephila clavipes]|nr:hypothetical protein TNCV_4036991 [Trichonephila clavipes]
MFRSDGESEVRPPVFKSPRKIRTHLLTHCSRNERLSRPCPAQEENPDLCSFADPTPLAHADASRDVLPRGGTSQVHLTKIFH